MTKIIMVIILIIISIYLFIQYLKHFYILLAINHIYIPMFHEYRELFKDNSLLKHLKRKRLFIYILFILLFISIYIFFNDTFFIQLIILITAFIIARFTFKGYIYEQNFMRTFSEYLK